MRSPELDDKTERVLVLAPTGRDGALTCRVLREAGLTAAQCPDVEGVCRELEVGAGVVLLSDEVLEPDATRCLVEALGRQPPWSDLPLVVATRRGGQARVQTLRLLEPLGNVTFLERPLRIMTLVSTIRMTLRARRRQYEIRELLRELEAGVRQRDEFLAMLAHELRNPLAPIQTAVELLRRSDCVEAKQIRWASDLVDRQARHLTRLVDDLLDVSRITHSKITLHLESVDVANVIGRAVETVRPQIDAGKHQLTVSIPGERLWVCADPARLAQVVTNLLGNAAKYTPEGGHIELIVSVRNQESGIRSQESGANSSLTPDSCRLSPEREVVIRVHDNGVGIPAELLPRVFDPFVQGERPLDRSQGGLGLGLAVVRSLIEMHGGRVEAHSDGAGRGSEFTVRLPLLTGPEAAPAADVPRVPEAAMGSLRVLVVDDNVDAADSLAQLLSLWRHDVRVVHDGPGAIAAAHEMQPDVVFLDIGLPGMDGWEVAQRLQQQTGFKGTLLVALTGYGQAEDRKRSLAAGFHEHLVKPVDAGDLQNVLARCARRAAHHGCRAI